MKGLSEYTALAGLIFALTGLVVYLVFFGVAWGFYGLTPTPSFLPGDIAYTVLNVIFVAICVSGVILMMVALSMDWKKPIQRQLMILGGFLVLGFFTLTTFLSSNQWFMVLTGSGLQLVWWIIGTFGVLMYLISAFHGRPIAETERLLKHIK